MGDPWDFSRLGPPLRKDVEAVLRRARRSAPGPDGISYSMWRQAGDGGAETIRLMLSGFVDGMRVPERFNEAWLVVLPKGSEDMEATGDIVRAADVLRPLLLKNADSKTTAATLAWAMRRIVASGAHASQRGFVARRDLIRSTVDASLHLVILFCDIVAAFPSVKRPWGRAVLRRQGMPKAAIRVVDATNDGMTVLLRQGGVHELGEVTSGIAQGCPLAGVLFVSAMDPVGRRLHGALRTERAGMSRLCADDTAVILRAASFLSSLAPVFRDAGAFAGVRLRPSKCEVVLIGRKPSEGARMAVADEFERADVDWTNFRVMESGKHLGTFLGPTARGLSWRSPIDKWRARAAQMAHRGTPACALTLTFTHVVGNEYPTYL